MLLISIEAGLLASGKMLVAMTAVLDDVAVFKLALSIVPLMVLVLVATIPCPFSGDIDIRGEDMVAVLASWMPWKTGFRETVTRPIFLLQILACL